jgi:hypothetical protein
MDETTRRLQIGLDLLTWAAEIPKLLSRIGEVSEMPSLTEAQKLDLELMMKRIVDRFTKASEMADAEQDNEALYESIDSEHRRLARRNRYRKCNIGQTSSLSVIPLPNKRRIILP